MDLGAWVQLIKEPVKRELPNLTRLEQQALEDKVFLLSTILMIGAAIGPAALILAWEHSKNRLDEQDRNLEAQRLERFNSAPRSLGLGM